MEKETGDVPSCLPRLSIVLVDHESITLCCDRFAVRGLRDLVLRSWRQAFEFFGGAGPGGASSAAAA